MHNITRSLNLDWYMSRLAIILILSVVIFFSNIWGISIYILDEAKNATCAAEMLQRGDLIVPTFNGNLRTDKPPLHYYFMMTSYALFGAVTPFTARLFSSCMGVLTVFVVFFFTKKHVNESAAFYTCLTLLSSLMVGMQFHLAVPDPYLIFFVTLGALLLFESWSKFSFIKLFLAYLSLALAFMTKGPISLVIPTVGILLFLVFSGRFNFRNIYTFRPWAGLIIVTLVALPWYYLVGVETNGVWLDEFFFKHNMSRFTSTMEGHGGFPFSALIIALAALLPFSVFLPQSGWLVWRKRLTEPFVFYCFSVGIGVIIFFLFSSTILPSYISPSLPFFAIAIGYFLEKAVARFGFRKGISASLIVGIVLTMALPVAAYFGIKQDASIAHLTHFSLWLLVLPVALITGFFFYNRAQLKMMIYSLSSAFIITFLIITFIILPAFDKTNPIYNSKAIIAEYAPHVYYYGRMNAGFAFYSDHNILKVESSEDLNLLLNKNHRFLIITREDQLDPLLKSERLTEVFRQKDLFENHTTVLLTHD